MNINARGRGKWSLGDGSGEHGNLGMLIISPVESSECLFFCLGEFLGAPKAKPGLLGRLGTQLLGNPKNLR
jgi:hypothetical protein